MTTSLRFRVLCAAVLLLASGTSASAQAPVEGDGASALGVALRRLGTTKRVLMIGAHPDDENTALIAELALGDGADVAYLSLNRGEGGQNLIGHELGEGLGIIRTEELLAARRLDGARQFFTRAYDYGYSRTLEEALRFWPRDTLLGDVVAVVRRYRPDLIVSVFSGTPADGHGQHQAAGVMAREAFAAAADPARFPGQVAAGLQPHRAPYLFQVMWRPPPNAPLRLATGNLDPLFGRSRYQIAMQSRSRHRSQDMGRAEPLGPQTTVLAVLDGAFPEGARTLFSGLDTTLSQHARTARADAGVVRVLVRVLETYERDVATLRAAYNPLQRAALTPALTAAVRALDGALLLVSQTRLPELHLRLLAERGDAAEALRLDAGVVIDVVASTPTPVPGSSFDLDVTVWNGGPHVVGLAGITPVVPRGWQVTGGAAGAPSLEPNAVVRQKFRVSVPENAERTEPYFLRNARPSALYDWTGVSDSVRGLPFEPAIVRADVAITIGAPITVTRDATYAAVDKAVGEVRRPLLVLPAAALSVEPRFAALPAGNAAPRTIAVTVSAAREGLRGTLRLAAPAGWRVTPASADVSLTTVGEARTVQFEVTPPSNVQGEHTLQASFESGGRTYTDGYTIIDYPHIRPHALYHSAAVRTFAFPVSIAQGLRIGYVEGAGDEGAIALRQLGATVVQLDAAALANADLTAYDAIVTGIRAYEVRPDLIANNARLLDYARRGGTFIVQYNKYELVEGGFMPYPATMARPHGRVADETAAVALLDPEHPLLSTPNRIAPEDFSGWIQERGLYFLDSMDPRYTPLLSMADPGESPQRGALVAARVGEGWYVYTGLALFRQLPEGVPGAWRLLANLVSLRARAITP